MGSLLRHCFIVFNLETFRTMLRLLTIFALSAILITVSLGEPQDLQFLLAKENEKPQISMNNSAEDSDDTNREGEKDSRYHYASSSTQRYGSTFEPFLPCFLEDRMAVLSIVAKIKKVKNKESCNEECTWSATYGEGCHYFNFKDHNKLSKRVCYLLRVEGKKKNKYFSGPEGCVFEDKYLYNRTK